ncbi:MAG: threonine--tRNA ligase [Sulfurospirillum sp.]|nr:threonine--tRNA ligase [Sulfurospirillum sp.]MBL0703041.1 threonine--tRNA ligase [Sulfurospirillum sp.]
MQNEVIAYSDGMTTIDTQSVLFPNNFKEILFDNSNDALHLIRHSTAHVMAQAIKELYSDVKFFVGPVIENGFYYDFRVSEKINDTDLKTIEKKMQDIVKKKLCIEKKEMSKKMVLEKFKNDDLKQEVLLRIFDEKISIYKQGDFEDICRGPHVPNTKYLRFFSLMRVAGAYLGGDENKEMLTRIYGTAFADKQSLFDYKKMIEEAKKRDHRKLGREMKLFAFDETLGIGLPVWLPNGAKLRSKLERLLYDAHRIRGYEPVRSPEILKSDTWKTSGHYENYGENMYFTQINEGDEINQKISEYGMKPMNCVGHIKIFQSEPRSYRDLPIKFFEYGIVHRHEMSGVLHGLFRVREFTQDDAHIYCMPEQIKENIIEILGFVDDIMKTFKFEYELVISTKPEKKSIGDDKFWKSATDGLRDALDENKLSYKIDEGGGAFYGPKIDIKILDALKRRWQCGTIQIDYNLPERFKLEYTDANNEKQQPVMIHRAILGSFERFIGILTEHVAGEFPFFIAPIQVIIIPISQSHQNYAKELGHELITNGIDFEISSKNESLNKRIRNAEKMRVPMILVLGDEEIKQKTVSLRDRRERKQYNLTKCDFITIVKEKFSEVHF